MRRIVAVLLTCCLAASTVEAVLGAVQHGQIHGPDAPARTASAADAPDRRPGDGTAATTHRAEGSEGDLVARHAHHGGGDHAPPASGHCAHFHTVAPVGTTSGVPSLACERRDLAEAPDRASVHFLSPLTHPPRA